MLEDLIQEFHQKLTYDRANESHHYQIDSVKLDIPRKVNHLFRAKLGL